MVGPGPRVRIAQTIGESFLQFRPNSFPVHTPMGAAQRRRRAKRETRGGTRKQDGYDYDHCGTTSCTWLTSRKKKRVERNTGETVNQSSRAAAVILRATNALWMTGISDRAEKETEASYPTSFEAKYNTVIPRIIR